MSEVFQILQTITKNNSNNNLYNNENILIQNINQIDPFENNKNENIVVYKTKVKLCGKDIIVRRAYVKCLDSINYKYVGWVFDEDMKYCMICGHNFTLFNRRHHCRVCGNLVCASCSTGSVRITDIHDYEKLRACDNCFIGQEEVSIIPDMQANQKVNLNKSKELLVNSIDTNSSSSSLSFNGNNINQNSNVITETISKLEKEVYYYQLVFTIVYILLYVLVLYTNK